MVIDMKSAENESILTVAKLMLAAAKTAPKGSGKDKIVGAILIGDDKDKLVKKMHSLAAEYGEAFIERDANNVNDAAAIVLLGAKETPFGLSNCGMCGFYDCREMKSHGANCAFNITDLGIAVGSAVSVAANHHIDNRVMYSAGRAAYKLNFLGDDVRVCYGIPLYTGAKSIFFDRNKGAVLR
ncbi:MAG: DUF2148 domain-containing protein [Peptostreptococcaceae bacterium]|nr:DUF2148 domain-containing protein [Peptostreptococcaceae bacterium]MDY5739455.1 DUF2148 domain-containing protein [Anaerovoracaceae bacterium]